MKKLLAFTFGCRSAGNAPRSRVNARKFNHHRTGALLRPFGNSPSP